MENLELIGLCEGTSINVQRITDLVQVALGELDGIEKEQRDKLDALLSGARSLAEDICRELDSSLLR